MTIISPIDLQTKENLWNSCLSWMPATAWPTLSSIWIPASVAMYFSMYP